MRKTCCFDCKKFIDTVSICKANRAPCDRRCSKGWCNICIAYQAKNLIKEWFY